jgi:hypothetical protein
MTQVGGGVFVEPCGLVGAIIASKKINIPIQGNLNNYNSQKGRIIAISVEELIHNNSPRFKPGAI